MMRLKSAVRRFAVGIGLVEPPTYVGRFDTDNPSQEAILPGVMTVVGSPALKKWAYLRCPCGCADVIMLPLSRKRRPRWDVSMDLIGRPTVRPSIRQTSGCMSHFWLRKGRVIWCVDV